MPEGGRGSWTAGCDFLLGTVDAGLASESTQPAIVPWTFCAHRVAGQKQGCVTILSLLHPVLMFCHKKIPRALV